MTNKEKLLSFLKDQKLIVVATQGDQPWVANIFYGIDDDFKIYFISSKETVHSEHILKNNNIAFSVAWFNPEDHTDRKGVQGRGICRVAKDNEEIKKGVQLHNERFPEFKSCITFKWAKMIGYRVWVIEPSYIKYWDDKLYGGDETEEFNF